MELSVLCGALSEMGEGVVVDFELELYELFSFLLSSIEGEVSPFYDPFAVPIKMGAKFVAP